MVQVIFPTSSCTRLIPTRRKIKFFNPNPLNNYFLLHFYATIFPGMFKIANFCAKNSKNAPSTGFLPYFSPKVQVFFHPPPAPNNWTIYTSVLSEENVVEDYK